MSKRNSRREFLCKTMIASVVITAGSTISTAWGEGNKVERPNILFAIADDWSFPHAGVYGDKVVNTPAFDKIAAEGMLFTHTYCAAPTCTPSRGAILTGQLIHLPMWPISPSTRPPNRSCARSFRTG